MFGVHAKKHHEITSVQGVVKNKIDALKMLLSNPFYCTEFFATTSTNVIS